MTISKKNKGTRIFTYQMPEDSEFISLKELYDQNGADYIYVLTGMYLSDKGKFGTQPVLLIPTHFVNAPKHLTETVKEILQDDEVVKQINDGNAGFKVQKYIDKNFGKECYSVEFVDLYDDIF